MAERQRQRWAACPPSLRSAAWREANEVKDEPEEAEADE